MTRLTIELEYILEHLCDGYRGRTNLRRHTMPLTEQAVTDLRKALSALARSEWGPEFDPYNREMQASRRATQTILLELKQTTHWHDVHAGEAVTILFRAYDVTGKGRLPCPACNSSRIYYTGKTQIVRCSSCRAQVSVEPHTQPTHTNTRRVELFVRVPVEMDDEK